MKVELEPTLSEINEETVALSCSNPTPTSRLALNAFRSNSTTE